MAMNSNATQLQTAPQRKKRAGNWLTHLILALGGAVLIYPLIFSFLVGFFTTYEFATRKSDTLFPWPQHPTLRNYTMFFTSDKTIFDLPSEEATKGRIRIDTASVGSVLNYGPQILTNSVLRTVYMTVLAVLTSLLGGYAFSRLKWKGRDKVFLLLLTTQMVPGVVSFIPQFVELHRWPLAGGNNIFGMGGHGLYNTFGVYLFTFCALNVMGTFLVRQSLLRTPMELDEAARVDGASTFRIIFSLLAPLQKPVLAYIAITTAIGNWNDWMVPFFFTNDERLLTLPGGITRIIAMFTVKQDTPNYPMIITLGMALTIPSLIILALFQKYMVEGLANTGIKG
ncbi:MAG TPA: carbohydrate ABC transporter permease [Bacillota bacterium]